VRIREDGESRVGGLITHLTPPPRPELSPPVQPFLALETCNGWRGPANPADLKGQNDSAVCGGDAMARRAGLAAAVAAILLAGTGCVCCGNKGYGLARDVGPDCDLPTCQRDQVYVFAVGGMNPLLWADLDELRERLNRKGFAKVATGQTVAYWWVAGEMRRVREDNPNAVFVLLGGEGGTATAVRLAEKAAEDGLPVGAVVLIDPEGKARPPKGGLRTLTLASPDAGEITSLLTELAAATPPRVTEEATGWHYKYAPDPRPTLDPSLAPEWAYMFDRPGGSTRPIGELERVIVTKPAPDPATTASRR
jgi:hypothetical protein